MCVISYLFQDLGSHGMTAVEDDAELAASLHLLQKRPCVGSVQGQLSNLQPDVVSGWGHDQLL